MTARFSQKTRSPVFRYGFAFVVVIAASLISHLLMPLLKDSPFVVFTAAVALSAWLGGFVPGLVTTVLAVFAAEYIIIDPLSQVFTPQRDILQIVVFALVALLISGLNEARRLSEEELRTSRDQLRIIFENVADGITVLDAAGQPIFANDAAAELLGYASAEEFVATPLFQARQKYAMYDEEDRLIPAADTPSRITLHKGREEELTAKVKVADTQKINWVTIRSQPVFDTKGRVSMAINILHDVTRLKSHERALQQQRERFEVTLNSIGDAVIVTDIQGKIEFMNPVAERLTGWQEQEAVNKPFEQVIHIYKEGDQEQHAINPLETALSEGKAARFQHHTVLKALQGGHKPVEAVGAPLRDNNQAIIGAVLVIRDISERRAVELEREHHAQFLHSILDSLAVFVGVMTPDGTLIDANQRALKIADLQPKDVLGKHFADTFWWSYDENVQAHLRDAIDRAASGESVRFDVQARIADQQLITIDFTISPLFDERGVVTHLVPSGIDITHRKRTEIEMAGLTRAIEVQRQRLKNVVANVPGVVWEAYGAPDSGLQKNDFVSDYAESMLGYTTEEWMRTPNFWLTIVHPDDKEEAALASKAIFENGKAGTIQFRWLAKDGRAIPVEAHAAVIYDEQNRPVGMRGVTMDITERKQAEEALANYARELRRSNEELQQFAYIASHDLQEPLRAVTSYLQLVEERYREQLDQDGKDFIDFAVDGAERMKALINDLLTYARVESRAKPFEPTHVEDVLDTVLKNLKPGIESSEARITCDPMPEILADRVQMTQLFQNLISNAIKFRSDQAPEIHICAERTPNSWLFALKDNGIGIEPKHQERIFAVFQRLHTRAQYEGTGIGLAVCRKVVERHGGRIWVESEIGEGTTFYFTIPFKPYDRRKEYGS